MVRKLFIITFTLVVLGGFGLNSLPLVTYLIRDTFRSPQVKSASQEKDIAYLQELDALLVKESPRLEQAPIVPLGQKRAYLEPVERDNIILEKNGIVTVELSGNDSSSFAVFMVDRQSPPYLDMLMQGYLSNNV